MTVEPDKFLEWLEEIIAYAKTTLFYEEEDDLQIRLLEQVRKKYLELNNKRLQ